MGDAEFEKAATDVKNLKGKPTDDELLKIYALFKQATIGDVNIDRPGLFDPKGKAKWDAWEKLKGLSQCDAKQQYVEVTKQLIETYGLN